MFRQLTAVVAVTLILVMSGLARQVFDTGTKQRIRVVTLATGLIHPWSIAFLPDGHTMLVAERGGRLRILRDGVLDPKPVWDARGPPTPNQQLHNLHSVGVPPRSSDHRVV